MIYVHIIYVYYYDCREKGGGSRAWLTFCLTSHTSSSIFATIVNLSPLTNRICSSISRSVFSSTAWSDVTLDRFAPRGKVVLIRRVLLVYELFVLLLLWLIEVWCSYLDGLANSISRLNRSNTAAHICSHLWWCFINTVIISSQVTTPKHDGRAE